MKKTLLIIVGIAVGMNASVAFAQHEEMPRHEGMAPGDHAKHEKNKQNKKNKKNKKDGDAEKKQAPKSDDDKHLEQGRP